MAQTKKQTAKKKMKEAVKNSVARLEARAKEPGPRDALLIKMGNASLHLARVQDEIKGLQAIHQDAQKQVQSIRQQIEKRGDGK